MDNNGCPSDRDISNFVRMIHLDPSEISARYLLDDAMMETISDHIQTCYMCDETASIKFMAILVVYPTEMP
jgi:hypothetical protein